MASVSSQPLDRNLSVVPKYSFALVEEYVRTKSNSSATDHIEDGMKYFLESYLCGLEVAATPDGCSISGLCLKSTEKPNIPYEVKVDITTKDKAVQIAHAHCTCEAGPQGSCGHIAGLLFLISKYQTLGVKKIPKFLSSHPEPTEDDPEECEPVPMTSLMLPFPEYPPIDFSKFADELSKHSPDLPIIDVLRESAKPQVMVKTKFGEFPRGSVLSYQLPPPDDE